MRALPQRRGWAWNLGLNKTCGRGFLAFLCSRYRRR